VFITQLSTSTPARDPVEPQSESLHHFAPSDHMRAPDRDPACFTVRQDDSSGNVTETGAECTCASRVAEPRSEQAPASVDEALRLTIKLAIDAEDYDRASAVLEVLKRVPKR
jgi:hypothetical protein